MVIKIKSRMKNETMLIDFKMIVSENSVLPKQYIVLLLGVSIELTNRSNKRNENIMQPIKKVIKHMILYESLEKTLNFELHIVR